MNWTSRAFMVAAVLLCIGLPLLMDNVKLANDPQLKILRELMPYWDRTESGGIVLLAEPPKEHAQALYRTLVDSPADASADSKLDDKWSRQLPSLTDKLARFFQAARLEPGTYAFANPYYQLLKSGELKGNSIPMNSDGDNPVIAIPQTESVTFTVTPDHVKLLRHMNTRSYGNYIEVMDPKRPYGDMTYFFIDMAAALGRHITRDANGHPDFSAQDIKEYQRLHGEMLWAVGAFLRYAKL